MKASRSIRVVGFWLLVVMAGGGIAEAQMPGIPSPPPAPSPMPSPQVPSPQMPSMPEGPDMSTSSSVSAGSQTDQSQGNGAQGAGFMGAWCVGGDPTKQASISNNGVFLNLTNESGSTSIGNLQGSNQIVAPGWQFVTGTLSRGQINWSNGSSWTRCPSGGGGGGRRAPNLNGNWYPGGNRSLSCSIQQRRGNLTLQNENGDRATGSMTGRRQVSTNWSGTRIMGTISPDGNRIDWSNGTYWIRYRLYGQ
jgi:hypothetical protein